MAQVPQIRQILHILITAVISSLQKTASRCIATTYIKLEQQCKEKIYKYISTWSILSVSETQLNNKLKIRATKKRKKEKKNHCTAKQIWQFEWFISSPWQHSSADTWRGRQLVCLQHIWWHQWVRPEPWPHPAPRLSEPPGGIELESIQHNGQSKGFSVEP